MAIRALFFGLITSTLLLACPSAAEVPDHLWSLRAGDGDRDAPQDIALDSNGNIIVSRPFVSSIDFGGGPLTSAGTFEIFLAKFDESGSHL